MSQSKRFFVGGGGDKQELEALMTRNTNQSKVPLTSAYLGLHAYFLFFEKNAAMY